MNNHTSAHKALQYISLSVRNFSNMITMHIFTKANTSALNAENVVRWCWGLTALPAQIGHDQAFGQSSLTLSSRLVDCMTEAVF